MTRTKRPPDFEKSLGELEQLVEQLEGGRLPLEDALRTFERGVALTRECQTALQSAQSRVEVLLRQDGGHVAVPFDSDGEEDTGMAGPDAETDD